MAKAHCDPELEAEIFYNLETKNPVSSSLRLGPLADGSYVFWKNLETENFKHVCSLLQPTYSAKSHLYYQLEMALQLVEHDQDPGWIFDRLKQPLLDARAAFVPAPNNGPATESLRIKCDHSKPTVQRKPETEQLSVPEEATETHDFAACCDALLNLLELYEIGLKTARDSDEFWVIAESTMEAKWRVDSLLEFHKNIVQHTSHPADLALVCYTTASTFGHVYSDGVDTDYSNKVDRKMAIAKLRLQDTVQR